MKFATNMQTATIMNFITMSIIVLFISSKEFTGPKPPIVPWKLFICFLMFFGQFVCLIIKLVVKKK